MKIIWNYVAIGATALLLGAVVAIGEPAMAELKLATAVAAPVVNQSPLLPVQEGAR